MPSEAIEAAREVYGDGLVTLMQVLPPLAAQIFFLSPMSSMKEIYKTGSVGSLPLLPYSMMMANGFLWMAYGLLSGDQTVIAANVPSLILGTAYTVLFLKYRNPKNNYSVPLGASFLAMFLVTFFWATSEPPAALRFIGLTGCAVLILMMGGPLATIQQVVRDRSTSTIPFPMAVATAVNCALWSSYGLLVAHDVFIYFPNLVGLGSGLAQLALFAVYGFAAKNEER
eukprot:TRINITY_DN3300_c7_g1_i1.p1 TRINITY_DN3300_c7_g1~~TRINITY_DN3300_c7_g1_i1.p1  ORF type:complete len:234 (+),score=35.14 TRINITY_DN3300_c7_g1_i1:23-703(+)